MTDVIKKCHDCGSAEDELPAGFIELTLRDSDGGEVSAIFCGFECAGDWLARYGAPSVVTDRPSRKLKAMTVDELLYEASLCESEGVPQLRIISRLADALRAECARSERLAKHIQELEALIATLGKPYQDDGLTDG